MNHTAIITFIAGSLCILVSTVPGMIRSGASLDMTRAAALFFISGSLMLW